MISWKIWRVLRNPPYRHPLFRRTLANRAVQASSASVPEMYWFRAIRGRSLIEAMAAVAVCLAMCSPIFLIVVGIGLLLILNGTGYSAFWAFRASGVIAQEREHGTYDLHCVSPHGALGVNWALFTGYLHRNRQLEHIHNLVRWLLTTALVIAGVIAVVIVSNSLQAQADAFMQEGMYRSWLMLVHLLALIAIIFIDHIHSIVLATVVSILIPTYARGRIDAQLSALGVFLALQTMIYLLTWFVTLFLLPRIYQDADSWMAQASLTLLQVGCFFLIREGVIYWLWRQVARRLDISSGEEAAITLSVLPPGLEAQ